MECRATFSATHMGKSYLARPHLTSVGRSEEVAKFRQGPSSVDYNTALCSELRVKITTAGNSEEEDLQNGITEVRSGCSNLDDLGCLGT